MRTIKRWIRLFIGLDLVLLLAFTAVPASAHTDDSVLQLSDVAIGPYVMTVWTYPGVLRAGSVHYTVALLDTAVSPERTPPTVNIVITPIGGGSPTSGIAHAVSEQAMLTYYETDLVMPVKGLYEVDIQLTDAAGTTWSQPFQIEVVSATFLRWLTLILLIQALAFGVWLLKESVITWTSGKPQRVPA